MIKVSLHFNVTATNVKGT